MQDRMRMLDTLKNSSLLKGLDDGEIQEILRCRFAKVRVYEKGDFVFREGAVPREVLLLVSGEILIGKDTPHGIRMILTDVKVPGELFGEVYTFMECPQYDMYAEAVRQTTVFSIDQRMFFNTQVHAEALVRALQKNLLGIFAEKAYRMNVRLRILGGQTLREKIGRFLFEKEGADGRIRLDFTREELADFLHVTRPSLSRELSSMAKEGILRIAGRDIRICDQDAFESLL